MKLHSMNENSSWATTKMQWIALALGILYLSVAICSWQLTLSFKQKLTFKKRIPSCQEEMQQSHQLLLQWNQQQTQQASQKDSHLQAGK